MDFRKNLLLPTTPIIKALRIIDGGTPIGLVHKDGKLLGTVTDGDIRRGIISGISMTNTVTKVMNTKPVTAQKHVSEEAAQKLMQSRSVRYLPLLDGGKIVGLKSLSALQTKNPVLLMAGGLGLRLRPITETLPKPMVDIGGKPLLQTIIERLVEQGFTELFVSLNYLPAKISDYFGDGSRFGASVTYLHENEQLGTAGALSLMPEVTKPLVVMNADVLTTVNFGHLVSFHNESKSEATIGVKEYSIQVPYGVVESKNGRMTQITEKPELKFQVAAGIYVLNPSVFENVTGRIDMPELLAELKPAVFPLWEQCIDVGRLDDLQQARKELT